MKVPVPFSSYASTRLVAAAQRRLNLYSNSKAGLRQFPGYASFGSVSTTAAAGSVLDTSSEDADPTCAWVSPDGIVVIMGGSANNLLYQYTLSTAWKLGTGTYTVKTFDLTSLSLQTIDQALAVDMSPSGDKLFILMQGEPNIYECDMTAAFDISTASETNVLQLDNEGSIGTTQLTGIHWRNGDEVWVMNATVPKIHQVVFAAGTDYTVNRSVTVTSSSSLSGVTSGLGMSINSSGTEIRVCDTSADIETFPMTTAWDTTTIGSNTGLGLSLTTVRGLQYRNGDNRFYLMDIAGDQVQEYSLGGAGRGMLKMAGILYAVIGPTLYSINSFGAASSLGTIANEPDIVGMSTDGTNLVITAVDTKYNYTTAGGLVTITDGDLLNANTSAFIDSRFYYDQPSGQFVASALSDPTSVDALDFATAESFGDALLAVFTHNQLIYMCGGETIEVWLSVGVGRPPVERQTVLQRGVIGPRAIQAIDNIVYFLDDKKRPNRMTHLDYESIYTPGLGEEWDSYTKVDDCIVSTYSIHQENFAEFTFPTENVTWTYHELSGQWSKRQNSSAEAYNIQFYENIYALTLGLDRTSGLLYKLDASLYQDNGNSITRTISTDLITSELYGVEGQEMIGSELTLTISAETGSTTVSVSFSTNPSDLTPTFSTARDITLSAGTNVYDLLTWGMFREGVFRITTSANDKIEIINAALDVELLRG